MVFTTVGLLVGQTLQVVGHLVASCDEQVEKGLLDGVKTGATGEEDAVGGAVDEDGFVGLSALVLLGTKDDAEGVGEEDSGVSCEKRDELAGGRGRHSGCRLRVHTEDLVTVEGFVGHYCGLDVVRWLLRLAC